jgi:hypothetical protein
MDWPCLPVSDPRLAEILRYLGQVDAIGREEATLILAASDLWEEIGEGPVAQWWRAVSLQSSRGGSGVGMHKLWQGSRLMRCPVCRPPLQAMNCGHCGNCRVVRLGGAAHGLWVGDVAGLRALWRDRERWLQYKAGLLVQLLVRVDFGLLHTWLLCPESSCLELGSVLRVSERLPDSPYPDDWFALEAELRVSGRRGLHLITGAFLRNPDGLLCWRRDNPYGSLETGNRAVDFLIEADHAAPSGMKEVQVVIRTSAHFGAKTLLGGPSFRSGGGVAGGRLGIRSNTCLWIASPGAVPSDG